MGVTSISSKLGKARSIKSEELREIIFGPVLCYIWLPW